MIRRHLMLLSSWICFTQGSTVKFHKVQFFQPSATSFATRTDQFITNAKIPTRTSSSSSLRHFGTNNFFSSDFSSVHSNLNSWPQEQGFFHQSSANFGNHFDGRISHITPDFSDGLSYPDPFLRTGIDAKRKASFLYSKELFFDDIPHVKGLLYNQDQRRKNGLLPHVMGSLRPASPWYRYKNSEFNGFGNSVFSF